MSIEWINKKRIAVFAHYDKDNVIDDYVIYYLNALKEVVEKIIFVTDGELEEKEKNKLQNIVDEIIAHKHGEYDFGSYKIGFLYALDNNFLDSFDELIFANDSCYGPFYSLKKVFKEMENKDCDFWGITKNNCGLKKDNQKYSVCSYPHLQSYFLAFKKNVFLSDVFLNFIKSIQKETVKNEVILKYELGLSSTLTGAGFKYEKFVDYESACHNITLQFWEEIILQYKMPFLKCSLPRLENLKDVVFKDWEKTLKMVTEYPIEIIKKNIKRTSCNKDYLFFVPYPLRPSCYRSFHRLKQLAQKFIIKITTVNKN